MAVTFTNKAAKEMINRINKLITNDKKKNICIGTFHSIAYRMLNIHYNACNLNKNFQIIDNNDQLRLIKKIIKLNNIDIQKYSPDQAISYINKNKNKGLKPTNIIPLNNIEKKIWLKIYVSYQEVCERSGLLDFGEILIRVYDLLLNNSQILNSYKKRFKNILIDEFQDTNDIQYHLIKLLVCKETKILIVGDDDQSIYTWRGAKIDNIYLFLKDFPNAKIIYLEQNYRSTNNILNAANSLIANNKNRFNKKLWTKCSNGELINLCSTLNEKNEAQFVINQILSLKNKGGSFNDCAILYRNNFQSRVLEEILLKNNVSYCIYGGIRFFDRAEIKNALAYLRLIINNKDDTSFERIINLPPRGIGKSTIQIINKHAKEKKISLWNALKNLIKTFSLNKRTRFAMEKFFNLINNLKKEIKLLPLNLQTSLVIEKTGLIKFYSKEKIKLENLEELVNATKEYINNNHQQINEEFSFLKDFLIKNILEDEKDYKKNYNSVKLMTIHTAKGLEFNQVFIVGMEEGLFPSFMSRENITKLEEERRLAYVGMTRAIEKLTLTYTKSRFIYGKIKNLSRSRFIDEIPNSCLKKYFIY